MQTPHSLPKHTLIIICEKCPGNITGLGRGDFCTAMRLCELGFGECDLTWSEIRSRMVLFVTPMQFDTIVGQRQLVL